MGYSVGSERLLITCRLVEFPGLFLFSNFSAVFNIDEWKFSGGIFRRTCWRLWRHQELLFGFFKSKLHFDCSLWSESFEIKTVILHLKARCLKYISTNSIFMTPTALNVIVIWESLVWRCKQKFQFRYLKKEEVNLV